VRLYYKKEWHKYSLPMRFSSNNDNDVWGYGAKKLADEIIYNVGLNEYNKYKGIYHKELHIETGIYCNANSLDRTYNFAYFPDNPEMSYIATSQTKA